MLYSSTIYLVYELCTLSIILCKIAMWYCLLTPEVEEELGGIRQKLHCAFIEEEEELVSCV